MLTVQILINDKIVHRSFCMRVAGPSLSMEKPIFNYITDCGEVITHTYDEGAVVLAQKVLISYLEEKCK